jgi:tetratricopeptide (TPR) repeat protein
MRFMAGRGKLVLGRRAILIITIVLVSVSVVNNGIRYWQFHINDHAFSIKEANDDLAQILGPGAVVSGPYGPALTFDTNIKSFIHMFGVAEVDANLFDQQPITHLAVDIDNYVEAVAAYRNLELIPPTASYYICNYKVRILDISQRFANRAANAYVPSDYERAMVLFHQGQHDSAYVFADQFFRKHPDSKSIRLLMADLLSIQGRSSDALQLMIRTADMFPTDFFVQAQCGRLIQQLGLRQNDQSMSVRAEKYYERAVAANHTRAEYVDDLRRDVIEGHGKR